MSSLVVSGRRLAEGEHPAERVLGGVDVEVLGVHGNGNHGRGGGLGREREGTHPGTLALNVLKDYALLQDEAPLPVGVVTNDGLQAVHGAGGRTGGLVSLKNNAR